MAGSPEFWFGLMWLVIGLVSGFAMALYIVSSALTQQRLIDLLTPRFPEPPKDP